MNNLTAIDVAVSNRVDLVLRFSILLFEESGGDLVSPGTEQTAKQNKKKTGMKNSPYTS